MHDMLTVVMRQHALNRLPSSLYLFPKRVSEISYMSNATERINATDRSVRVLKDGNIRDVCTALCMLGRGKKEEKDILNVLIPQVEVKMVLLI